MTKQKGKAYQELEQLIETFEYETTRNDFSKCCDYDGK